MHSNKRSILKILDFFPILMVLATISFLTYTLIEYFLLLNKPSLIFKYILMISFTVVLFFILITYVLSIITDPGRIPENYKSEATPIPNVNNINDTLCLQCSIIRPPRAHHCKSCERCFLKMDHHCPWIANCVGLYNQKYFVLFVFYSMIGCLIIFISMIPSFSVINTISSREFGRNDINNEIDIDIKRKIDDNNLNIRKDTVVSIQTNNKNDRVNSEFLSNNGENNYKRKSHENYIKRNNNTSSKANSKNRINSINREDDDIKNKEALNSTDKLDIGSAMKEDYIKIKKSVLMITMSILLSLTLFIGLFYLFVFQINIISENMTSIEYAKNRDFYNNYCYKKPILNNNNFKKEIDKYYIDGTRMTNMRIVFGQSIIKWFIPSIELNEFNNGFNFDVYYKDSDNRITNEIETIKL